MKVQLRSEPNSQTRIRPRPRVFKVLSTRSVKTHQEVRLASLDRLPPIDERGRGSSLCIVYRERVDVLLVSSAGLKPKEARSDGTDDSE